MQEFMRLVAQGFAEKLLVELLYFGVVV